MIAKTLVLEDDETRLVTSNWTAEIEKRSTTVSSSAWEVTSGTLASAALSGAVATVKLTESGPATLKNTATLANGEILIRVWKVEVK